MIHRAVFCMLAVVVAGCQSIPHKSALPDASQKITAGTMKRLAGKGIPHCTKVSAFAINRGAKFPAPNQLLLVEGKMNPNRTPLQGVELTDSQINSFLDATTERDYPSLPMRCFMPHHAIAFYTTDGRLMAHYDICFSCLGFRASDMRATFVGGPDYKTLRRLFKELSLLNAAP